MRIISRLDPHGKYEHILAEDLIMSLGYIPEWAVNSDYFGVSLFKALDEQYGFGMYETTGGKVHDNGVYDYPDDPPLYPIAEITRGDETLYQYPHEIVAIVQKDGSAYVTRMD